MALGTVTYAEHDHVLQELFHERLRARNLERRLRGAHTALVEIERLALSVSKDTREQILSEAQGALREIDPLNMRGAIKAALDRQVEELLAGGPPSQAEMEAFWRDPEYPRPLGATKITIRLRTDDTIHSEHEMNGPHIGIPTRGAAWVYVSAEPGPTTEARATIERLTLAIETAARALETEET